MKIISRYIKICDVDLPVQNSWKNKETVERVNNV